MQLGFISLVLTVFHDAILSVCVPASWDAANTSAYTRRQLGGGDEVGVNSSECADGTVVFITAHALHQTHLFIFIMASALIVTGSISMLLCVARCAPRAPRACHRARSRVHPPSSSGALQVTRK